MQPRTRVTSERGRVGTPFTRMGKLLPVTAIPTIRPEFAIGQGGSCHETVKRSTSNRRLPMRSAVGRQAQERPNSALAGCPCNGNFNALRYQSAMRNSIALWIEPGSCAASPPEAKSARPNLQPNHDAGAGLVPAASSRHPAQSDILRPAVGKVPRMCRWQILEVVKCHECRD